MNDDPHDVGCPSCGDDSDSCLCFVVITWEGSHLADWRGDLEHSALDEILEWGYGAALVGAPNARTSQVLADLPGALAAGIEGYWLEASVAIELEEIGRVRNAFIDDLGASGASGPGVDSDPADARHPWHDRFRRKLVEEFGDDLRGHDPLSEVRISLHVTWAELAAAETSTTTARSGGVGTSSVWQSVTSPDPEDTWRRMTAMLRPALAVLGLDGDRP